MGVPRMRRPSCQRASAAASGLFLTYVPKLLPARSPTREPSTCSASARLLLESVSSDHALLNEPKWYYPPPSRSRSCPACKGRLWSLHLDRAALKRLQIPPHTHRRPSVTSLPARWHCLLAAFSHAVNQNSGEGEACVDSFVATQGCPQQSFLTVTEQARAQHFQSAKRGCVASLTRVTVAGGRPLSWLRRAVCAERGGGPSHAVVQLKRR